MKQQILASLILALPLFTAISASAQQGPPDREKMRAAMEACATEKGLAKPSPGQRPSDADRKVMEECLAGKGFTRPPSGPRGHHRGQHGNQQGAESAQ